jgi:hypothetical protein
MNEFKRTTLWRATLGEQPEVDGERAAEARERLRSSYLALRDGVKQLVSRIAADIPGLTVHDISHLDALWDMASLIAGPGYALTPAEGYVLGGGMLLHDAAMTLAAFPGGLRDLKCTPEWADAVVAIYRRRYAGPLPDDVTTSPPDDVQTEAIPVVLRLLHGKQAARLAVDAWPPIAQFTAGQFLIEDVELRGHYGPLIGQIAASHWWNIDELERQLPPQLGAPRQIPRVWTVDPVKVACLLRVADAAHVTQDRAPSFARVLERPSGVSAQHWEFQSKMASPVLDDCSLVYTSSAFEIGQADAWWLAFDTLCMVDRELTAGDRLLRETSRARFSARGVKGASDPHRLVELVRTEGWTPIETRPRVSDASALARMLGGRQLYGHRPWIALRELLQNAADAIRVRRCQSDNGDWGLITVSLSVEEDGTWLDVLDNGIGMREGVLTGKLLDFGGSLWASTDLQSEFPGLLGKGLRVSGRFGIGFFSIFMLGRQVKVASWRFGEARDRCNVLEFRNGLDSRAILRSPRQAEVLPEFGTRVSVRLDVDPVSKGGLLYVDKNHVTDLGSLVKAIAPSLDVSVNVNDAESVAAIMITASDWKSLAGKDLFARGTKIPGLGRLGCGATSAERLRLLQDEKGRVYGRACIEAVDPSRMTYSGAVVTLDGLRASIVQNLAGVLLGAEPRTVVRDEVFPSVPLDVLRAWASHQAVLLSDADLPDEEKVYAAAVILALGGDLGCLPFVFLGREAELRWKSEEETGQALNLQDFRAVLEEGTEIYTYLQLQVEYDEEGDNVLAREFRENFVPNENIFFVTSDAPVLLRVGDRKWPECLPEYSTRQGVRTPWDLMLQIVGEVWGEDYERSEGIMDVGYIEHFEAIKREVSILKRRPAKGLEERPESNEAKDQTGGEMVRVEDQVSAMARRYAAAIVNELMREI